MKHHSWHRHKAMFVYCYFDCCVAIDAVCLWPVKIRATLKVCTTLGTLRNLIKKQKHAYNQFWFEFTLKCCAIEHF